MGYFATILADSISPAGHRLTTFQVTFPRIVLAEINTHRMLSRNSASSRAVPVEKRIAAVDADPFVPEAFGRNQKGMQPGEALAGPADDEARRIWRWIREEACSAARDLAELEVHKQYANRLLEPFAWHTAILSATDWDNFWHLRVHPAAQGEFSKAAAMMLDLYREHSPYPTNYNEWHLPLLQLGEVFNLQVGGMNYEKIAEISAARCARVSYLTHEGKCDPQADLELYEKLTKNGHTSPLEHPARPMTPSEIERFRADRYEWAEGWVRVGSGHYLGNFNGWVQLRKLIPGEHDILGHRKQDNA
jgi:thymidylate synthase ThyX